MTLTLLAVLSPIVALRKESVDRNTNFLPASLFGLPSLSARRAWIEITGHSGEFHLFAVALRKESVDRNAYLFLTSLLFCSSLSARRAWIEIAEDWLDAGRLPRRSPQGERG